MPPSQSTPAQPQAWARTAGLLYLVIIVIGLLGEALIRGSLVVAGDPDATVRRILDAEALWRLGVAAQDLLLVCAVGLTWTWYVLLRPVSERLTWLAVFFGLVSLAVESVSALHLHAVLTPLSDAAYLNAIDPRLLHLQAYQAIVAHAQAFGLALIFFGVECLLIGHLVRRSGFLPKWIGTLMQLAGACYLVNSFSMVLHPPLQALLFPLILLPALVGESAFCLWLLVKGVDVQAWTKRTGETRIA
jgi:hypothetical protein